MNTHSALIDAAQMTGLLAIQVAIVVLAATALQPLIKSTQWRRTLWQVCVLAITLIVLFEFSGFGGRAARLAFGAFRATIEQPEGRAALPLHSSPEMSLPPASIAEIGNPPPPAPKLMPEPRSRSAQPLDIRHRPASSFETIVPWLALAWLLGTGLLLSRTIISRIMLILLRRRSRRVEHPALQSLAQDLSAQLGIRARVKLMECKRLRSPVAFGLFAKVVALPPGFAADHSEEEQAVILAHELAHLAGYDSWWCLLAESASAVLWWHPLVWFARRSLQQVTESAADEASLLVENGPPLLAQCLVALGRRLQTPDSSGGLHIGGFSSGLGQRIENLLKLSVPGWRPANRLRMRLAKIFLPITLLMITALCSGWISPRSITKENTMKDQIWRKSLPAIVLLALLNSDQQLAAADNSNQVKPAIATTETKPNPLMARNAPPAQKRKGADAVRRRLEQIVFTNIQYDSLPLTAVIESLTNETIKRDPERIGVNFLLGKDTSDPNAQLALDPRTGLPIPGSAPEPIDLGAVSIRIMPPMRNVRLIDALEAIVKMADRPITYSIQEYGVIFTAGSSSRNSQTFETRTFKISPSDSFFKGIEVAFGIKAPGKEEASREVQQEIFHELFGLLGIDWSPPKSAFFNELTGMIMVRAAAEDMSVIAAAIETLGGTQSSSSNDTRPVRAGK